MLERKLAHTGFPTHGPIACNRCFANSERVAQVGRWRVVNDPGAWGSSDPEVLVLGFSKGFTQASAYAQGDFDDVAFKKMRPRLTDALRAVGLLSAIDTVDDRMRSSEKNFAFGSLVRCSLSRRVEEIDSPGATYSCTGSVMPLAFREEVSRAVRRCAETYLGDLPPRLRLVVMLGTGDPYVEACRDLVRSVSPAAFKPINSVSYESRGVIFCHISHPSPGNGHHTKWLTAGSTTKSGGKREEALAAVRMAGFVEQIEERPHGSAAASSMQVVAPVTNRARGLSSAPAHIISKDGKSAMTLKIAEADAILRSRLGEPVKPPTNYIIGFKTTSGKVLAIHRDASETRIWFQGPQPPKIDGVQLLDRPSNANSNINGPLQPLRSPSTLRVEIISHGGLDRFLDWYAG